MKKTEHKKMIQTKRILSCIFACLFGVFSYAQHSTSSPYSTIGIGELDNKVYGLNSGMANTGIGTYIPGFLNITNPAALAIDSLSFIFDVSLSGNISQYSSAGTNEYSNNVNVKKVAFGVRTFPRLIISGGLLPYSNVQYRIQSEAFVEGGNNEKYSVYHQGTGGLSKLYLAGSYKVLPNWYLGANASYLFGRINRTETVSSQAVQTTTEVDELLLDFGLLYNKKINSLLEISAGLVYGYQNEIKMKNYKTISSVGTTDTKTSTYTSLPQNVGVGFSLLDRNGHGHRLFALDYKYHNWANIKSPDPRMQYADSHKVNAGIEYVPNYRTPRSYLQRVHYQVGGYFEKSNLVINGKKMTEMGVTIGAVFPLKNNVAQALSYQPKIFFSADFGRKGGIGLINENYIRINLGVSLNQVWFMKWFYD